MITVKLFIKASMVKQRRRHIKLTILYSGMRVGEAIALKENRVIPIPKFLTTELKKYQLATPKNTEGLVFCFFKGTPLL